MGDPLIDFQKIFRKFNDRVEVIIGETEISPMIRLIRYHILYDGTKEKYI